MKISFVLLIILLAAGSCNQPQSRLYFTRTDEGIEITEGASKVLFYQIKPKSLDGKFKRAHYVHPLYSLDGQVITEDFPEDHLHHHGIFTAWHQVLLDDKPIADAWMSENIVWEVKDANVVVEDARMTINSEVFWNSSINGKPVESIVKETVRIVVYGSDDQVRIIDFDMTLLPLTDTIKIGGSEDDKGYGGFSLRLKLPADINFIAKGKAVEPQVTSVDAGAWMNFIGSFDVKQSGPGAIAVFCHPSNAGSPHSWILRKEKSMQNPAYPGRHPVALTKEGLTLRYRLVIQRSPATEEKIDALYQEYARL